MAVVSTADRAMMIGMLRQGQTATQILNILNVIVPDSDAQEVQVAEVEVAAG